MHLGGRDLLDLARWLAAGAGLALIAGVFLLWVVDRAADGRYTVRLAISGILTTIVLATTAIVPIWRHTDSTTDRPLIWLMLAFAVVIAVIFAIASAWLDARPLKTLANRSSGIAGGHFEARLPETGNLEIAQTAIAVNLLASRAQSSAIRQSNQDRTRESLLLAIAADAQIPIDNLRSITQSMLSSTTGDPGSHPATS